MSGPGRGARRREEILRATLRIVGERGVDAVTHRAVAEEAGVPLAATTYYFASKDDLLEQALLLAAREEVARAEKLLGRVEASDPEGWVAALAAFMAAETKAARTARTARFELALEAGRRPALQRVMRDQQRALLELAEMGLRSADSPDPPADASILLAALAGLDMIQLATHPGAFPADELETFIEHLVERLAARRGALPAR